MKNIYGYYYKSQDTLVDFFPYIPFGQWVLNQFFVDPNIRSVLIADTTLLKMRGIWFVFAITVWIFSIIGTFYILRLKKILKGGLIGSFVTPTIWTTYLYVTNYFDNNVLELSSCWENIYLIFITFLLGGCAGFVFGSILSFFMRNEKQSQTIIT